jgi:hypothetical protein
VGVLVDQKFGRGLTTSFFGRPVQTNPLLAKLVRQFDAEVYPARCIRLPGNRYRLEIEPRDGEVPSNASGRGRCRGDGADAERQGRAAGCGSIRASGCGITTVGRSRRC